MFNQNLENSFMTLADHFADRNLPVLRYAFFQVGKGQMANNISGDPEERRNVYSVSKTFIACAIGLAVAEGRLRLDDHLIDFFPEFESLAGPWHKEITLKNLLQMQSGKNVGIFYRHKRDTKEDYAEIFFKEKLQSQPGKVFHYANLNTYMLGRVIAKVSGQEPVDYLEKRLFEPLGFENMYWAECPNGHSLSFTGLELSLDQLLSFGRLLLKGGVWAEQELLPADFVRDMHSDIVVSDQFPELEARCGYGYQVWRSSYPDSWRADGMYGQFALIYPHQEAVFACLTESKEDHEPYDIIELVNRHLIERLELLD